MYMCILVSVFCSRHFSVKQLKFKMTSFCVNILITVFSRVLKLNIFKVGEIKIFGLQFPLVKLWE